MRWYLCVCLKSSRFNHPPHAWLAPRDRNLIRISRKSEEMNPPAPGIAVCMGTNHIGTGPHDFPDRRFVYGDRGPRLVGRTIGASRTVLYLFYIALADYVFTAKARCAA